MSTPEDSEYELAIRAVGYTATKVAVERGSAVILDGRTKGFIDVSFRRDGYVSEPSRVDLRLLQVELENVQPDVAVPSVAVPTAAVGKRSLRT